jgi:hypothetical protein
MAALKATTTVLERAALPGHKRAALPGRKRAALPGHERAAQ